MPVNIALIITLRSASVANGNSENGARRVRTASSMVALEYEVDGENGQRPVDWNRMPVFLVVALGNNHQPVVAQHWRFDEASQYRQLPQSARLR